MSLFGALERARTEEDVKDAYIKALGLKSYFKGLVDIQTEEVWFEAKAVSTPPIVMFGQLLVYVRAAKKRGEPTPAFLAVIDREKAAIMPTEKALPLLDDKTIVWPTSGSGAGRELATQIAPYVQTHIVEYEIAHDEMEFVKAVRDAMRERRIIRAPITPVPFSEAEVGAKGRFASDFMVRYMAGLTFSPEARAVLDEGRKLWTRFHATQFPRKIRDEYKLGRPDAGWYQIRRALEAYGDTGLTDFDPFRSAYAALSTKLRPMVFELGFLPE